MSYTYYDPTATGFAGGYPHYPGPGFPYAPAPAPSIAEAKTVAPSVETVIKDFVFLLWPGNGWNF
jgi:hypothetical protein